MEHSVISKEVKLNNKCRLSGGGHLDKLAPVSNDLLSGSGLEPLVAAWDLLALHPHPGYDVAFQHSHQLLLVAHQLVQGVNGNLIEGSVGRGENGERALGCESLHHAGGFEGGVESGEVLVLGDQGGHGLAAGLDEHRLLGWARSGDEVGVGSAEVWHRAGHGRSVREVILESSDGAGNIAQQLLSLGQVQGAQRIRSRSENWSPGSGSDSPDRLRSESVCRLGAGRGSEGCGAGRRMGGGGVLSGVGGAVMLGVVSPVVVSVMVAAVVARSVTQGEAYKGGHEERA